ncbi:hypothetical protein KIMH_02740 [Bombiscardovia apis]|uniref:Uncharacterized protein n=1 Tax=Bombiscardovia apis TaxID=2932182 RepID=A0ABN6SF66_9BIFI|nr:hypothetical protein [Bombiscardovia apis]BDR54163.1 hypothetical protein KIMH_02740 [Bombiscardovia apis]
MTMVYYGIPLSEDVIYQGERKAREQGSSFVFAATRVRQQACSSRSR